MAKLKKIKWKSMDMADNMTKILVNSMKVSLEKESGNKDSTFHVATLEW